MLCGCRHHGAARNSRVTVEFCLVSTSLYSGAPGRPRARAASMPSRRAGPAPASDALAHLPGPVAGRARAVVGAALGAVRARALRLAPAAGAARLRVVGDAAAAVGVMGAVGAVA